MDSVSDPNAIKIPLGIYPNSEGLIVILIASCCQDLIPNTRHTVPSQITLRIAKSLYVTIPLSNVCIAYYRQ